MCALMFLFSANARSGNHKKKVAFEEIGLWFIGDIMETEVQMQPGTPLLPCASNQVWTRDDYPSNSEVVFSQWSVNSVAEN
jgi:hypothetical protein